jgi:UDP-3-O-[3-hydroxymyristoyl] glucosamine N-acyltransferase
MKLLFFIQKNINRIANNTKASFCITTENLKKDLPNNCKPIIVENVLVSTSIITTKFYPNSIDDNLMILLRNN